MRRRQDYKRKAIRIPDGFLFWALSDVSDVIQSFPLQIELSGILDEKGLFEHVEFLADFDEGFDGAVELLACMAG